jgi:hypothetical protein
VIVQCGRQIKKEEIAQIRETVETFCNLSRSELAHTVCEHLGWHTASGGNKVEACMKLFKILEDRGIIQLPAKRVQQNNIRCTLGKQAVLKDMKSSGPGVILKIMVLVLAKQWDLDFMANLYIPSGASNKP